MKAEPKLKRHPDYGLKDQVAGRCPFCLASADMDCDCEKKAEPTKDEDISRRFAYEIIDLLIKSGFSEEYINSSNKKLEIDLEQAARNLITRTEQKTASVILQPIEKLLCELDTKLEDSLDWSVGFGELNVLIEDLKKKHLGE